MQIFNSAKKLHVFATPIGNLDEVSFRFIKTIQECDVLLCEDTRVTKKLLTLLSIDKSIKLIKFELHNEKNNIDKFINIIKSGTQVGLISDAGYPTISDPGYNIVNLCIENEIFINVVNGPSSVMHALVASGMVSNGFMYLGFIGKTKNERRKRLQNLSDVATTFVIFESPHRIMQCIDDIKAIFPSDAKVCLAHELTKLHESFIYSKVGELENENIVLKGEYVIILQNNTKNNNICINFEKEIIKLKKQNYSTKDISQIIGKQYNISQRTVYREVIKLQNIKSD